MSWFATNAVTDFDNISNTHGVPIVVRFRDMSQPFTANDYDVVSGTTMLTQVSGIGFSGNAVFLPLNGNTAGEDVKFLEQGLVKIDDSKLFITGSLGISGNSIVDIRSSGNSYGIIQILPYTETGSVIYRKAFVRKFS